MTSGKFLCVFIIISLSVIVNGQDKQSYITQRSKGIILGVGFLNEQTPENNTYQVYQLIYNYSIPLLNQNNIKKHNLILQFEPQINPIHLKGKKIEIEAGINFGFIYNYRLSDNLLLDFGIGSGPHFITINTKMQARGFVFSNNFILGISKRIKDKTNNWELSLQIRLRHMSNMKLLIPNSGLDHLIFYCGISKLF